VNEADWATLEPLLRKRITIDLRQLSDAMTLQAPAQR
jgi:hypothetical protein